MLSIYRPAPFAKPLPQESIPRTYAHYRFQVMACALGGYAGFYLVRKNFSLAKPYLINELGFTTGDVGLIGCALSIAYGISKFYMGHLADRANPRYFLGTGLIFSGLVNLFFGFLPSLWMMFFFWFLNGWAQGMGYSPCVRVMTHWFSDKERGVKFSLWNISHNVGGGIVGPIASLSILLLGSWRSIFYVPGALAVLTGIACIIFLRDTPQSVGLPPIEEFKNDYPPTAAQDREKELSSREIFFGFIFNNKTLWILAVANIFVYVVRYGVLDWAPTYLTAAKNYGHDQSRWLFLVYEYAGIPGMLLSGWASDRFFHGRRGPVSALCMLAVTAGVVVYWLNPPGHALVDTLALLGIGFFVYGPVMLVGLAAVDSVPKKAAGTAAGLTGFFGYLGGATIAELGIGKVVQHYGWDGGFQLLLWSCALSTLLLSLTWNAHDRRKA
ncbi:MAG: MFS transporter [Elusimicrobia bacterium]|nr:MFS transporter [Elusimicrobiota bacterium]